MDEDTDAPSAAEVQEQQVGQSDNASLGPLRRPHCILQVRALLLGIGVNGRSDAALVSSLMDVCCVPLLLNLTAVANQRDCFCHRVIRHNLAMSGNGGKSAHGQLCFAGDGRVRAVHHGHAD